ncbi:hypothetical protein [Cellulomonas sp. S1-8]|uniref:hypothetical protein n=1 Tax=Cellulomonas sp. S1-8 TaxID=2904790 RepID=UPI002244A63A|nr:hypothetical protein [Cellulomonas sp. S1-8]UZN01760.1 hypothetical protein OKX07_11690 [Cellulomonas sp. S1-8]
MRVRTLPTMSYNMSLAVVRDTTLEEIGVDDPTPVSFDLATGSAEMRLMGAQVGPHVLVADALLGARVTPLAAELGRQVYLVTLSGVSDTYVLEAHGPATRLLVHAAGEVVENRGEPLPVEALLASCDDLEDAHLALVTALAETVPDALWHATFVSLTSEGMPF